MPRLDPLPYVREARPRNLRLADLYLRHGEAQAEAEIRNGLIKAKLWGDLGQNIGQTAAAIIEAPAKARLADAEAAERTQRAKLGAIQVGEAERQVNDRENANLAIRESGGAEAKAMALLKDRPDLHQSVRAYFQQQDDYSQKMLKAGAAKVREFGYTPEALDVVLDSLEERGYDKQTIGQFRSQATTPDQIKALVDQIEGVKPDLMEVSPGATVVDKRNPSTSLLTAPNPAAEAAAAARAVDDERQSEALKETTRHNRAMEAKPPSMIPVVVQTPQGPAVLDRRTNTAEPITMGGQAVGVTPTAAERMDSRKFSKAAPVLKGIGELSDRINTLQGVYAKAAGEVAKQKAKINLDDDVAEYESLVSGFTPMIARALGHTGVLTQQDVDSVKALFPRPGDSKTLRDRKINRMMGIIGELEGVEGITKDPNAPQDGDIEYDTKGNRITKPKGAPQ